MTMRNVGSTDAGIRLVVGLGLLVLAAVLNARPFLALAAAAIATLVLGTALTRSCPVYVALGITTCAPRQSGKRV